MFFLSKKLLPSDDKQIVIFGLRPKGAQRQVIGSLINNDLIKILKQADKQNKAKLNEERTGLHILKI